MNSSSFIKPLQLIPHVQHYHWGIVADSSLVGRIAKMSGEKPCAELWMGAHPDLPSELLIDQKAYNLKDVIDLYPSETLGESVIKQYGSELPFLFKILSVGKPLSIQAHPDKELAARLFRDNGYPDDNHKPEMAIALSQVELLCGFRHISDMVVDFARLPELKECVGEELFNKLIAKDCSEQTLLRELCLRFLSLPTETVRRQSIALKKRLDSQDKLCHRDRWIKKLLRDDFEDGDVGIFIFYAMNLITLSPGYAVFIPPNTAHAYLSGELAECMANSDNVVRGGLTPKTKDIKTLITMLDYRAMAPKIISPESNTNIIHYLSPLSHSEFQVQFLKDGAALFIDDNAPAIFLSLDAEGVIEFGGESTKFKAGDSFFIPSNVTNYEIICEKGRSFFVTVPTL